MVYIAFIAWVAGTSGAFYIMFPELGALAYDVFSRPHGRWSNSPAHLATTPALTGAIGILITRNLSYGFASVLLNIGSALAVIIAFGSPIAPAISAGLLPLVLGVKSWWYPPGILFGTVLLAGASFPWRSLMARRVVEARRLAGRQPTLAAPKGWFWAIAYLAFIVMALAIVELTGLRFILFPPLAVIGFEMFGHIESCAWADHPFRLPVVCFLAAAGGLFFHHATGSDLGYGGLKHGLGDRSLADIPGLRAARPGRRAVADGDGRADAVVSLLGRAGNALARVVVLVLPWQARGRAKGSPRDRRRLIRMLARLARA